MFFVAVPADENPPEESCEALYHRYGKLLFRVCYSILCNKADAEDAVQDVFYKYLLKRPVFSDEEHAKAWLLRVASNQSKDMLRKRKYRVTLSLEEIEAYEIMPEQAGILADLLKLPEKYKTVLVLHYLENFSIQEIALTEQISESAVKMRLLRGREMLKNATEGREADNV